MNDTFSFRRFGLLMKRQWIENQKLYLLGIMGIVVSLIFSYWLTFELINNSPRLDRGSSFLMIGIIFLFFFSGTFYNGVNSKEKGMFFYSLPTSKLEKLAVTFSYTIILFSIIYLGLFFIVDFLAVHVLNSIYNSDLKLFSVSKFSGWDILVDAFLIISALVLGSVFLGKKAALISGIAICLIGLLFPVVIQAIIAPEGASVAGLHALRDNNTWNFIRIENPAYCYLKYILLLLCWILLFLKLKEKEV